MIKLFKLNKEQFPEISDESKLIKEFKDIWTPLKPMKGDVDGRKKYLATRELAYVYWEGAYGSNYKNQYPDDKERLNKLKIDLELPENWKPDKEVLLAIDKYKELSRTPTMKIVESQYKSIEKIINYLDDTDLNEVIEAGSHKGELIHDPKKYMDISKNLTELTKACKDNEKIVEEEIAEKTANRAGRTGTIFNE